MTADVSALLASLPVSVRDAVSQALAAASAGAAARMVPDPNVTPIVHVWRIADRGYLLTAWKAPRWEEFRACLTGMGWTGADAAMGRPFGMWGGPEKSLGATCAALEGAGYRVVGVADYAAACAAARADSGSRRMVPDPKAGSKKGPARPAQAIDATAAAATLARILGTTPTPPQG